MGTLSGDDFAIELGRRLLESSGGAATVKAKEVKKEGRCVVSVWMRLGNLAFEAFVPHSELTSTNAAWLADKFATACKTEATLANRRKQ